MSKAKDYWALKYHKLTHAAGFQCQISCAALSGGFLRNICFPENSEIFHKCATAGAALMDGPVLRADRVVEVWLNEKLFLGLLFGFRAGGFCRGSGAEAAAAASILHPEHHESCGGDEF